jgi:hypothetical protein
MPRVVHFEIGADKPDRAVKFYRDAFDWKIETWGEPLDYWLCTTGPNDQMGINGAITKRPDKGFFTVNTIGVANLKEAMARVRAAGGRVLGGGAGREFDEIPGIGLFVYCEDTEGNRFGMLEPKMPAS